MTQLEIASQLDRCVRRLETILKYPLKDDAEVRRDNIEKKILVKDIKSFAKMLKFTEEPRVISQNTYVQYLSRIVTLENDVRCGRSDGKRLASIKAAVERYEYSRRPRKPV